MSAAACRSLGAVVGPAPAPAPFSLTRCKCVCGAGRRGEGRPPARSAGPEGRNGDCGVAPGAFWRLYGYPLQRGDGEPFLCACAIVVVWVRPLWERQPGPHASGPGRAGRGGGGARRRMGLHRLTHARGLLRLPSAIRDPSPRGSRGPRRTGRGSGVTPTDRPARGADAHAHAAPVGAASARHAGCRRAQGSGRGCAALCPGPRVVGREVPPRARA